MICQQYALLASSVDCHDVPGHQVTELATKRIAIQCSDEDLIPGHTDTSHTGANRGYKITGQIYIFQNTVMYNKITNLQVTSFGFSIKSSSDLFNIKSHTKNLYLHVGLRSHYLTVYVIKPCVKIHKSCVKL
jgi:hypothetical protein